MRNIRLVIRERVQANVRFVCALGFWAIVALVGILLLTAYTVRLDIAFMEANHMIKNEDLRGAIFLQSFNLETWLCFAYPIGIIGNSIIAALFSRSQDRYFARFREAFENFGKAWVRPDMTGLGLLEGYARDFMVLVQGGFIDGNSKGYRDVRNRILAGWADTPKIYWRDQFRFALLSGALACYFSSLCMMIFWHVNGRIYDLSRVLTIYTNSDAPQFFLVQMNLAETIGWTIVAAVTVLSILTGIRFSSTTSNAAYACGRQLKRFLEGDHSARIVLRYGDPGREDMAKVNVILSKLEEALAKNENVVAFNREASQPIASLHGMGEGMG